MTATTTTRAYAVGACGACGQDRPGLVHIYRGDDGRWQPWVVTRVSRRRAETDPQIRARVRRFYELAHETGWTERAVVAARRLDYLRRQLTAMAEGVPEDELEELLAALDRTHHMIAPVADPRVVTYPAGRTALMSCVKCSHAPRIASRDLGSAAEESWREGRPTFPVVG